MSMIAGMAALFADGISLGEIEYKITVRPPFEHGLGSASGVIYAKSEVLLDAYEAKNLRMVRRDTGQEVQLILTAFNLGDAFGQVSVSGSPGDF